MSCPSEGSLSHETSKLTIDSEKGSETDSSRKELPNITLIVHEYFIDEADVEYLGHFLFKESRKYVLRIENQTDIKKDKLADYERIILRRLKRKETVVVFMGEGNIKTSKLGEPFKLHDFEVNMLNNWWLRFFWKMSRIFESQEQKKGRIIFVGLVPRKSMPKNLKFQIDGINGLFRSAALQCPECIGFVEFDKTEFESNAFEYFRGDEWTVSEKGMFRVCEKLKEIFETLAENEQSEDWVGDYPLFNWVKHF